MGKESDYVISVWKAAVDNAEQELMRVCPSISGGRKSGETVEQYMNRCINIANEKMDRLRTARWQLAKVQKEVRVKKADT